jgi:hypothetical protein
MPEFEVDISANVRSSNPFKRRQALAKGITVELAGGLGNQLFMYGTALQLSRNLQCALYLDTTWFKGEVDRSFALSAFDHDGILITSNKLTRKLSTNLHKIFSPTAGYTHKLHIERDPLYDSRINGLGVGTRLRGYFQSWKYFSSIEDTLRKQVSNLRSPSPWYRSTCKQLQVSEPWLAIHFRRGDYLNENALAYHGVLGRDYYDQAIAMIDSINGKLPIVIFSDDLNEAHKFFRDFARLITFVQPPPDSHDVESMLLMAQSSAIITANSSFSWWAGWLGNQRNRIVVVPKSWNKVDNISGQDLFLKHWIQL